MRLVRSDVGVDQEGCYCWSGERQLQPKTHRQVSSSTKAEGTRICSDLENKWNTDLIMFLFGLNAGTA